MEFVLERKSKIKARIQRQIIAMVQRLTMTVETHCKPLYFRSTISIHKQNNQEISKPSCRISLPLKISFVGTSLPFYFEVVSTFPLLCVYGYRAQLQQEESGER